jgi:hypothetical protein
VTPVTTFPFASSTASLACFRALTATRAILVLDAMAVAPLPQVFAQELPGEWIDQPHLRCVPLHADTPSDPAWQRAIVGSFDFHAAVQVDGTVAVLAIAKRFERQREQRRPFFSEHHGDLALGGPVNARIRPALLPAVQIGLRIFEAFEAHSLQRRFLRVTHARFDFAFAIGIRARDKAMQPRRNAGARRDTAD